MKKDEEQLLLNELWNIVNPGADTQTNKILVFIATILIKILLGRFFRQVR